MDTTSACHASSMGLIAGTGSCDIKIWLSTLVLCIPHESENHVITSVQSQFDLSSHLRILFDSFLCRLYSCLYKTLHSLVILYIKLYFAPKIIYDNRVGLLLSVEL